ncbi:hypothetical protein [Anaeroselena agilis]|uniref:Uncharacterized protein n=1 Tax=Anaeroselena agilis TaxID=3063788 RepID=A0ABU3P0Z7_9FIRM|nr:hypothetical protein [Selenomonadales bacterium 4137-cl]
MRIIRVFARRTSYCPDDDLCFFGSPGLFIPDHDEVHVVCVFTWDIPRALKLQLDWQAQTDKPVKVGGPAFDDPGGEFTPGLYCKQGITITSRGCTNSCVWDFGDELAPCFVPVREGRLRELKIWPGHIVGDNNVLATSPPHLRSVFDMLKGQARIMFKGGLEAALLTDWVVEELRGLRVEELWLAADTRGSLRIVEPAIKKLLAAGFPRWKIRVYVLIGNDMEENLDRLRTVFDFGALPFAQLYQGRAWKDYSDEWKMVHQIWSRPARYKEVLGFTGSVGKGEADAHDGGISEG